MICYRSVSPYKIFDQNQSRSHSRHQRSQKYQECYKHQNLQPNKRQMVLSWSMSLRSAKKRIGRGCRREIGRSSFSWTVCHDNSSIGRFACETQSRGTGIATHSWGRWKGRSRDHAPGRRWLTFAGWRECRWRRRDHHSHGISSLAGSILILKRKLISQL